MITKLANVTLCDPASQLSVATPVDLYLQSDRLINKPEDQSRVGTVYDLTGKIAMAGGVDIHTHIGGGKVNLARLLLPERIQKDLFHTSLCRPLSAPVPGTWETGRRYLEMGYTACFEPAVLPCNAHHAHMEMADTPWLDTGGFLLLGNEDLLMRWIAEGVSSQQIRDYIGWMINAHRCLAVKVVNAGGINAFKFNQRSLDVDEKNSGYGVTPRHILRTLAEAIDALGLAHPLHVHCSNLGIAGNIASTLATVDAVEGRRLHLTHAQFHCYGTEGVFGFSSESKRLAEVVNSRPELSIDVGQVLFGQTVTLSGDLMHQFANRNLARPRKQIFQDLECQAGCGVLPFRYRHSQYVHGLQWAIGLELFLLINNPYQVFLTTDHPNGAPFTSYPHLIRLLMDYDFRMSIFSSLHPEVQRMSLLPAMKREYTLEEIAIVTRTGPAKSLGLKNIGHLNAGAKADVVIYSPDSNPEAMFAKPEMIFKNGTLVFHNGEFISSSSKNVYRADVEFDSGIESKMSQVWDTYYPYSMALTKFSCDSL